MTDKTVIAEKAVKKGYALRTENNVLIFTIPSSTQMTEIQEWLREECGSKVIPFSVGFIYPQTPGRAVKPVEDKPRREATNVDAWTQMSFDDLI